MGFLRNVLDTAAEAADRAASAGSGAVKKVSKRIYQDGGRSDYDSCVHETPEPAETESAETTLIAAETESIQTGSTSNAASEPFMQDTPQSNDEYDECDRDAYSLDSQFTTNKQKRHSWE